MFTRLWADSRKPNIYGVVWAAPLEPGTVLQGQYEDSIKAKGSASRARGWRDPHTRAIYTSFLKKNGGFPKPAQNSDGNVHLLLFPISFSHLNQPYHAANVDYSRKCPHLLGCAVGRGNEKGLAGAISY